MKIGIYGGTFDPIHRGHIDPVLGAVDQLGLDRVHYLPTGDPPHKQGRRFAPALLRYAMAELALLAHPRLWVSGLELAEEAPSYTVDSVRHFAGRDPAAEIWLILGADAFLELETYREWREIVKSASLAILPRSGSPLGPAGDAVAGQVLGSGGAAVIDCPTVDVSSTEVRRRLARGERPPEDWMPALVVDFALKYRLYS